MSLKFEESKKTKRTTVNLGIIVVLIGIATFILYDMNANQVINVKEEYEYLKQTMSLSTMVNQDDYVLQRINEEYRNSKVEAYYPVTKYDDLNTELKKTVDASIKKFKENVKDDLKYSIFINFDMYKYDKYVGYVFHVLEDFAGAHPNTYIFTVNYDMKSKNIISINTLIKKNNNILNLMSKYSFTSLSSVNNIKEINMVDMLKEGTKPVKSNFDNFVFTKDGILVYFEKYQIAPYAAGEFCLTIPYEELNLKMND